MISKICKSRPCMIIGICIFILTIVLINKGLGRIRREMFQIGYNTAMIKHTLDEDHDDYINKNISDEYDDDDFNFDISGMGDCPQHADTDDPNIFLLTDINQKLPSNISYFEPTVEEMLD